MSDHDQTAVFSERRRHPPSELHDALLTGTDVPGFLEHLVQLAVATLGEGVPGGVSGAVTVMRDERRATLASTDELARLCDEALFAERDNTATGAIQAGTVVVIDDLAADERLRRFRTRALSLGVRSAMFLPLDGGPDAVGALNLYSLQAHAFGAAKQAAARYFAADASRALALAVRHEHDREITEQLRAALDSRTTIDQGIGIIMGQNRCDADAAFAILRAASQHRNVKLRLVSAEIITAVSNKAPVPGRSFNG
ncbi:GAF and ANTAR domain-containing protein [Pengzhenrongella frigida]|uniref:ANTAR domain-containing protein n=1 Tax=Pengzhenrongella frigida TaxID=1259133 RepID=A0A4V1ZH59_9MICO|nr:GAF and ANTAR domain-containing protein [Cellulomonas sp. HLT2-17]RYV50904.1 ANTAR domain-containing protein [Cellulomonas sp. HLT2-17]